MADYPEQEDMSDEEYETLLKKLGYKRVQDPFGPQGATLVLPEPKPVSVYAAAPEPPHAGALTDEQLEQWLVKAPNSKTVADELAMRKATADRDFLTNITDPNTAGYVTRRMGAQAMGGAIDTVTLPIVLPSLYGLVTKPLESMGLPTGSTAALEYAQSVSRMEKEFYFGVGDPRNIEESISQVAGSLIPIPGPKKMQLGLGALEAVTPFVIGPTIPKIALNAGIGFAADQSVRELLDNETSDYDTVFDKLGTPDADVTTQTARGPMIQGSLELGGAGLIALPLLAPIVRQAWVLSQPSVPKIAEVRDIDPTGPGNLATLEKTSDQYGSWAVDDKEALVKIAERSGVPDPKKVTDAIDLNTQISGQTKVKAALDTGKLHGQTGDFNAPIPPRLLHDTYKQLPPKVQEDYDKYLKLGDYADDLRLQMQSQNGPTTAAAELQKVQTMRQQMRAQYPLLEGFSAQYQGIMESTRTFLGQGGNAMLGQQGMTGLGRDRKHYVPLSTSGVDPTASLPTRMAQAGRSKKTAEEYSWLQERDYNQVKGIDGRENSIDLMMSYVHNTLTAKLNNDVRGVWVEQMINSGENQVRLRGNKSPLIREATDEEVGKFPTRVVTVFENGVKKNYITGQLQAQIMRLDPYMVQHALTGAVVASRRLFERGTTGVLSITFAPVTLIRDTFAGIANARKDEKGPGFVGSLLAPFDLLGQKATETFVRAAEARLGAGKTAIPFVDPQAAQQFVQRAANSLQNSLYIMANEAGGFDASLMRTRIGTARGAMDEIGKSVPDWLKTVNGYSFGPIARGFTAIFDSLQEAPRYSATKRQYQQNLRAGATPKEAMEDAVQKARKITGDTNRSGKVYDKDGRRITADAVDPWAQFADPVLGGAIEAARLAIPYVNPSIQGMRRAFNSAAEDPVRFMARNWITVGLPVLAAQAWNQWLSENNPDGHDYNEYQFNQRSLRDQVMEPLYIAIPGMRPEEGISIPLAHEQTLFGAPYAQMLQHLSSSDPETSKAMGQIGMTILNNALPVSVPPALGAGLNAMGVTTPQLGRESYDILEDNVGFLPQNIEMAIRSLFGSSAAYGLDAAAAFVNGGPDAAIAQFGDEVVSKIPVVKGLTGNKTKVTYGTPLSTEQEAKLDAWFQFKDEYEMHFDREGMLAKTAREGGVNMDVPVATFAPLQTPTPTNPLYGMFGEQIYKAMSDDDYQAVKATGTVLTDQLRLLKRYNQGFKEPFKQHQEEIKTMAASVPALQESYDRAAAAYEALPRGTAAKPKNKEPEYYTKQDAKFELFRAQEALKVQQIIDENELDLSKRYDVNRLISLLENERYAVMKKQLALINTIEDNVTTQLQAQGLLQPGQKFLMERDLAPMGTVGQ